MKSKKHKKVVKDYQKEKAKHLEKKADEPDVKKEDNKNMVNPRCKACSRYISEVELKSSGEHYKSCKKCREIQKVVYTKKSIKKEDEPDDKSEPDNNTINLNDIIYTKIGNKNDIIILNDVVYMKKYK